MTQIEARLAHDDVVRGQVLNLLRKGYSVKARLEGWFDPPEEINGFIPDIVARRGTATLIVEVKLGNDDWPKLFAFKRFVAQHHRTLLILAEALQRDEPEAELTSLRRFVERSRRTKLQVLDSTVS